MEVYMGVNQQRMNEINKYLSKENLEKAYNNGYSSNYIAKKLFYPDFITSASVVIKHAKLFKIKTRSIKESNSTKHVLNIRKNTCLIKYGYENPSQVKEIKDKKEKASLDKYGVINVFQSNEIKEKIYKTCKEKYGYEKIGALNLTKRNFTSKFHKTIETVLKKLKLKFKSEVRNKFAKYNDFYKKKYNPILDIVLDKYKLVIECNGDLWHANPSLYSKNDIIYLYKGPTKAEEIWKRDQSRVEQIESFGYKVLIIWEKDWKHNKQQVENVIKDTINKRISELSIN